MIRSSRFSLNRYQFGLILLLILALLAGWYATIRFGGWGSDGDELIQAISADSILTTHRFEEGFSYNNGYTYGVLLAFITQVSGLSPYLLVAWGKVWLVAVVLTAFLAYRELLGEARLAVFSTLLLLLIPDFLFYVLRGGHERVTWMLALLMLFSLARSLRCAASARLLLAHIICFYLFFWAMASTNVYFASTFVNAISIALIGGLLWVGFSYTRSKQDLPRQPFLRRLLLVNLACLILVFIFITYTYRPALHFYYITEDFVNRLSLLILGAQEASTPASFAYLEKAWIHPIVYLALAAPQFLLAAFSFIGWLADIGNLSSFDDQRWFLWWLYGAFGGMLLIGTLADFAGFLQGNLQMRMFTPYALFIAPMSALLLQSLYQKLPRWRPYWTLVLGIFIIYSLTASMAKVTNEPLISNTWAFYAPSELQAGRWMNRYIQTQRAWVDTWSNLPLLLASADGYEPDPQVIYESGRQAILPPFILITQKTIIRANRISFVLPAVQDHNQVYDNGFAWLYYRRARTPYQR